MTNAWRWDSTTFMLLVIALVLIAVGGWTLGMRGFYKRAIG